VECTGLPDPKDQSSARLPKLDEAESALLKTNTLVTHGNSNLDRKTLPMIGAPRIFAGRVTATNTMNGVTIESTPQNAELLHFCKLHYATPSQAITNSILVQEYVMPGYVSVDGKDLPPMFMKDIFPWMIQSPLMPNIAILMSSFSLRLERGLAIDPQQTISIKSHVLALINQYLKQEDFSVISDEAIRAVTHLVISEV